MAAQELVIAARGNPTESFRWQLSSGGSASTDDITVFVVPLKYALAPLTPVDDDDVELLQWLIKIWLMRFLTVRFAKADTN